MDVGYYYCFTMPKLAPRELDESHLEAGYCLIFLMLPAMSFGLKLSSNPDTLINLFAKVEEDLPTEAL